MKRRTIKTFVTVISLFNVCVGAMRQRGWKRLNDKKLIDEAILPECLTCDTQEEGYLLEPHWYVRMKFNPYVLMIRQMSMCAVMANPDTNPAYREITVYYDNIFAKLSQRQQIAFLHHELAHIKLEHNLGKVSIISQYKRMLMPLVGKVSGIELEADMYAAKCGYKRELIEALKKLRKDSLSIINKMECTLRIKALENLK